MILLYIGIGLGALIGAYILYMFTIAILPGFSVPKQHLNSDRPLSLMIDSKHSESRQDVCFEVDGTSVSAWLYLPESLSVPVPCIVMGHGLGGTKDTGLDSYAVRFQETGFAVLAFDFRYLGDSGGEPRQLVWIPYQLEDWSAAVEYARGLEQIDPARIALWGTSLSGGHVVVIAAKDHRVACIASQCPLLDGKAGGMKVVKRVGLGLLLRLGFVHGLRDLVRSWLRLSPHKVPLVGKPGSIAMIADAEAYDAFRKLVPDDFKNEICARIIIRMDKYAPIRHAAKVRCPALLQVCDKDIGLPPRTIAKAEKRLGKFAEVIHYPIDHFDIYLGEHFEKAVNDQLAFFKKHLQLGRPDPV